MPEMTIVLVVNYYRGTRWEGFDTYYIDHHGHMAGAFLTLRGSA